MTALTLAAPFGHLWHAVGRAVSAWTMRRELDGLDDRMLKDLGISRAQAEFQAGRGAGNGIGSGAGWHTLPWHIGPHHDA